jgi:hypothetical protein
VAAGAGAPKLTPRDALLVEVIDEVGGRPDTVPPGFWEEVAERWDKRVRFPSRSPDSHARHWRRLQEKFRQPEEANDGQEA